MKLSESELESLRFRMRLREQPKPMPDTHKMPDKKFDSHTLDKSTDMTLGDVRHHFPPKGN
ncbi:hypothetical protein pEaSNUABM21_00286 [Erwinia phage pEa_SNUABM_21]|nr:hypothetical protein pEaSNUABM21_00286 [Erwinia phage pEa_SNUABM_21]